MDIKDIIKKGNSFLCEMQTIAANKDSFVKCIITVLEVRDENNIALDILEINPEFKRLERVNNTTLDTITEYTRSHRLLDGDLLEFCNLYVKLFIDNIKI